MVTKEGHTKHMKMTLTRGLPGSGKTTWAMKQDAVRINRDDLRYMLFGKYVLDQEGEVAVTVAQHGALENVFKIGVAEHVIVDDTNLNPRWVRSLLKIAQKYKVEVEYKDFIDVSVEQCIANVEKRMRAGGREVPDKVIQGMHDRYIKGRTELPKIVLPSYELVPYERDETNLVGYNGKAWAIIVDIDGTIAKMADRSPYEWMRVGEDSPVDDVLAMISSMNAAGYKVLFTSGRDASCRDITVLWIKQHANVHGWELFMRPEKDQRPDWIVKAEIFDQEIRDKYNVRCVFDDRDQVVSMWRKLGLTVAQVAEGDF